jgi:hypothetical protein
MSIYGGFTTRHQESVYNDLTLQLLDLMQQRLLEHPALKEDLVWSHQLSKVVKSMKLLEQHKYLDPKLTQAVDLLFSQVDGQRCREQLSTSSSLRSDKSAKPTSKSSELQMTAGKPLPDIREELGRSLRVSRLHSGRRKTSSKSRRKPLNLSSDALTPPRQATHKKWASNLDKHESPRRKKQTLMYMRSPDLGVLIDKFRAIKS